MAIAVLLLVACESADKAPAAAAITTAQTAIDAVKGEAVKYVPDQVKGAVLRPLDLDAGARPSYFATASRIRASAEP